MLRELVKACRWGQKAPTNEALLDALGDSVSLSTAVAIVRRLEHFGLVRVDRFQRGRIISYKAFSTAAPRNRTSHWRAGQ